MPRLLRALAAGAVVASGLAGLVTQAPKAAAVPGMRVSLIGDSPLTSLMNASPAIRANLMTGYPNMWIDGATCRGSVRSSCQDDPPARGLPASAYDVVRANSGQLGDVVVLVTGYNDLIASPNEPTPDLTPFRRDFETLVTALHNEPGVQHILMLNLRVADSRLNGTTQQNKYNHINTALQGYDNDNARFPKLRVLDWATHSTTFACAGALQADDNCFQNDGITPRVNNGGANGMALYLNAQLDALPGSGGSFGTPLPVGNRCLPQNGSGFAPWSYQAISPGYPPAPPPPQTPEAGRFRSIDPVRLLDTRPGDGDPYNRMIRGGLVHRLQVTNEALGVPPSAVAVSLNITVAGSCAGGFVSAYPCGPTPAGSTSNLNFRAGQIVPNAVTVRVGTLGRVCLFTNVQADLVVDLNGYYDGNLSAANLSGHAGTNPARIVDTRPGFSSLDPVKGKVAGGTSRLINLVGLGAVPAGTTGVVLNVTATEAEGSGFLTVFPATAVGCNNRPNASNVNYLPFQNVANYVAVRVPGNGRICVFTLARSHIVVDRVAIFGGGGTNLRSANPVRLVDTRTVGGSPARLPGIKGRLQPMVPIEINIGAAGVGLPGGADAAILNVTAVNPSASGFISVFPCGPWPGTSSLNYVAGDIRPNQVDARLVNGRTCLLSLVQTDVVVDLLGWYTA